jgi:hypothetical protein
MDTGTTVVTIAKARVSRDAKYVKGKGLYPAVPATEREH